VFSERQLQHRLAAQLSRLPNALQELLPTIDVLPSREWADVVKWLHAKHPLYDLYFTSVGALDHHHAE
jgi:hypothetical protein